MVMRSSMVQARKCVCAAANGRPAGRQL